MNLARHTIYNLTGQLLPLALSLLTLPIYLRLIGEVRFGIMSLLWLFVGYMGLFDFGIGQATARHLSRSEDSIASNQSRVLWTAVQISLGLGLIGALIAHAGGVWFFANQLVIEDSLRVELLAALPWAVLAIPAVTLASVLNGGLQARNEFGQINAFSVLTNTLVALVPLGVAATISVELPALVAAVVLSRTFVLLLQFWFFYTRYLTIEPMSLDRNIAFQLLGFGGWTTTSAIVGPLLVVLDRFLIGANLGAKAVSHYVIPFQLAERTTALSSALGYALFPRLAACSVESEQQQLAMHGLRVLAQWTSPLVALGLNLIGPFLAWWVSPELADHSAVIAQILCLTFWLSSLAMVPYIKLLATGRPDLVAKSHLLQLIPYALLLLLALQTWGLVGAALAFAVRVVFDFLLLSHWADILTPALKLLVIPACLLLCALGVAISGQLPTAWKVTMTLALPVALLVWSLLQGRQRIPFSGRNHL